MVKRTSVLTLDWDELKRLFEEARALPPEQHEAFLDDKCGHDRVLRDELVLLLSSHQEADGYLEDLAIDVLPGRLSEKVKTRSDGPEKDVPDPLIGRRIAHYQIEERLGGGGMGVVYKARHLTLGHFAALKFLPLHLSADSKAKDQLQKEAKAAYALDHTNICTIYDIGETDAGQIFIAMAYYEGETLKEKIRSGPISLTDALGYAAQICEGLAKAHSAGIIHLDIKPANVIVTREGVVKLLDFGVARAIGAGGQDVSRAFGTVAYMSPEQARGSNIDRRTDIWSLGVVLHEMLTGEHPYFSKDDAGGDVLKRLLDDKPIRSTETSSSVSADAGRIITKCLKKRLHERYHTAASLFADLHHAQRQAGIEAVATRIFISYEHNAEPDNRVADAVRAALAPKHNVSVAAVGLVGTRWIEQLESDLAASHFLIVLLSENSVFSEMVLGEIELASRLSSERGGGPVILPVRLAYRQALSYPLSEHLRGLNWIQWHGEQDTPRLIDKLRRVISGGILDETENAISQPIKEPDLLSTPFTKAQPRRAQSRLYVERKEDQVALREIAQAGVTITIKGPRQMGKSLLLARVAAEAASNGKAVAFLDFHLFDGAALQDTDVFFREFCSRITEELGLENRVDSYWRRSLANPHRCTRYLARHVLPSLSQPVLLAMDEVERIFDAHFQLDFFSMLRSWHNDRAVEPVWKRLDLALVTSTEPYELIKTPNLSPFNVGLVIELQDFSQEQVAVLNDRHGAPLSEKEVVELTALLGGHPYLVRRALFLTASQRVSFDELTKSASEQQGPFGDHLRYHLFWLHSQQHLLEALRVILRTQECEDETVFWQLAGAGLVRQLGEKVLPRNPLYADFFRRHLLG